MKKEEFLEQQTRRVFELYEKHGCTPAISEILYQDGTVKLLGSTAEVLMDKNGLDLLSQEKCKNPEVIACVFICEARALFIGMDKYNPYHDFRDSKTVVLLFYTTRDDSEEFHAYIPTRSGKLKRVDRNEYRGCFCNPFNPDDENFIEY